MRSLHDLDAEIRATEGRLEQRRLDLRRDLSASRERTRRGLASPGMLMTALVLGFSIERLGRLRRAHRTVNAGTMQRTGMAGLAAGLGAAAVRTVLANPALWQSMRALWAQRKSRHGENHGSELEATPFSSPDPNPYPFAGGRK